MGWERSALTYHKLNSGSINWYWEKMFIAIHAQFLPGKVQRLKQNNLDFSVKV